MIIAIDARPLKEVPFDGIGWFTLEVTRRLVTGHPEHRFVMLCDRRHSILPVKAPNVEYVYIPPRTFHPVLWYFWHEVMLPGVLRKTGADILISTDGIIPLRTDVPCITVIHDLNFEHRPGDLPPVMRCYYRRFFPLFAARAARIATVSVFSAEDISRTYGIEPSRIDVVTNGVADVFSPPGAGEADAVRRDFTGGRNYFLFVGNISPRKNIETLVEAYNIFRRDSGISMVLLIAGRRLYLTNRTDRIIRSSPYSSDIVFTGSVSRDVLRRLYGGATALTFVSWFEGFGIPVVEAQRCGTPCILSDTSSLPEVSGGAALCAGPAGAGAIAEAMARLVSDEALRRRLSEEGMKNAARYTWDIAAQQMWNSVMKVTSAK